jgi:2-methylcitrate dehydratase PrpD
MLVDARRPLFLGQRSIHRQSRAALANGTMGHALDFDDVTEHLRGHPSVPVTPVVLALGEAMGASGLKSSPPCGGSGSGGDNW